ncbi:uncharacterized protein LOC142731470 [Rhinoderma darwinii]|uniref:uncharacterized protein LOC142731470 n=1 Tax=Rhinoderma darwinii TaxID=43563 RepID=UPI003F67CE78
MRQLSSTSWGFYLPLDQHGRIIDGSSRRNPPERCPSPLYSQDCPEENPNVPENHQREDLTDIKVEDEEEERVRGAQPCKSEVEEEIPGGVTRVCPLANESHSRLLLTVLSSHLIIITGRITLTGNIYICR